MASMTSHIYIFFTVLHNVWYDNLQDANQYLFSLSIWFDVHLNERISMEDARDNVHHLLHKNDPTMFPMGAEYASAVVGSQALKLSKITDFTFCAGDHMQYIHTQKLQWVLIMGTSIAKILGRLMSTKSNRTCTECHLCGSCS